MLSSSIDPAADRFAAHNSISLVSVGEGRALAELRLGPEHLNAAGGVHGGAMFALADFAFAQAANSRGAPTVALTATISYFKPPIGSVLTAEAREVADRNRISGFAVDVRDAEGSLVASFNAVGYKKVPPRA
jgi:acyl-CoA thioesterase